MTSGWLRLLISCVVGEGWENTGPDRTEVRERGRMEPTVLVKGLVPRRHKHPPPVLSESLDRLLESPDGLSG